MMSPASVCSSCGFSNAGTSRFCQRCSAPLASNYAAVQEPEPEIAINILRVCAVLDFLAGVVLGALLIDSASSRYGTNPAGLTMGIACIVGGIFGCAFLFVVAGIASDLKKIKRNTSGQ